MLMRRRLFFLLAIFTASTGVAAEQSIAIGENRRVAFDLPDGFLLQRRASPIGVRVAVADPQQRIVLELTLVPDPEGSFNAMRSRKEFLAENFQEYVECSVEQEMRFEEFPVRGTYFILNDARLLRKPELPPNEYRMITIGMKALPGCVAIFTLLSNDTASAEYNAILTLLRDKLHVP